MQVAFLLGDREAAGSDLLRIRLVHVRHDLLESGGVEAVGENRGVADDMRPGVQFVNASAVHLSLDGILQGFDHLFGFVHDLFPLLELLDDSGDLGSTHDIHSFHSISSLLVWGGCGVDLYPLSVSVSQSAGFRVRVSVPDLVYMVP